MNYGALYHKSAKVCDIFGYISTTKQLLFSNGMKFNLDRLIKKLEEAGNFSIQKGHDYEKLFN